MNDNFGELVESMDVASGYIEAMGVDRMYSVVSGCCYKEVYRHPHNNYYFSLLYLY